MEESEVGVRLFASVFRSVNVGPCASLWGAPIGLASPDISALPIWCL